MARPDLLASDAESSTIAATSARAYYSASALRTSECLERYWRHYVLREVGPESPAAKVGRVTHRIAAAYARHCVDGKLQTDLSAMPTIAAGVLNEAVRLGEVSLAAVPDLLRDADHFARSHMFDPARVIEVERKWDFVTQGGHLIVVIPDRLEWTEEGEVRIVDYKGSLARVSEADVRGLLQTWVYSLAVLKRYPDESRVWFRTDQWRLGRDTTVLIELEQALEFEAALDIHCARLDALRANDGPWPAYPGATCQYCEYPLVCTAAKESRPVDPVTEEEARAVADKVCALRHLADELAKGLHSWASAVGPIQCSGGGQFGYWPQDSMSLKGGEAAKAYAHNIPGGWDDLRLDATARKKRMTDEAYASFIADLLVTESKRVFGYRKAKEATDNG